MRINQVFIAFVLCCMGLFACTHPKNLVYQDVKNFKVLTLSLNPEIGMDLQFYNPNTFGVTLKDANIDVYINGRMVGKTSLVNTFHVPGSDTTLVPVKLQADLTNLFANAYSILANKEVTVRLNGSVKAGKGIFVNIPIAWEGKQRLNVTDFK
jgi:LEA14-like dessication related protein